MIRNSVLTILGWGVLASGATPMSAQDLVFDIGPTVECMAAQDTDWAREACVGRAASVCMELTDGGTTTVGMGGCLDRERAYWDGRLNASFITVKAQAAHLDAQDAGAAASRTDALVRMQRAWIVYRDERCFFERAKWGGGTGGGPATLGCLMVETARQTLLIERGAALGD